MKKVILFLAIVLCYSTTNAQDAVFKTYEDFVKGTGEPIQDLIEARGGFAARHIIVKDLNGEKVKYEWKDIWGYTYKGFLFRVLEHHLYAMLVETGKINYWINGSAGVHLLFHPESQIGSYSADEPECYLSVGTLDNGLYSMPTPHKKRDYPDFKKDHPEFQEVFDCIENNNLDDCVHNYNLVNKPLKEYQAELAKNPGTSYLLSNFGQYFLNMAKGAKPGNGLSTSVNLDSALIYLNKAYDIDPKNTRTIKSLIYSYMLKGDCDNTWKFYNILDKLDIYTVHFKLKKEIKENCKK
jgi:hypothetical protein